MLLPTLRSYLMALSLRMNGTIIANVEQKVGANSNKISPIKQKPTPEDIIKHVKPILADLSSDALLEKCLHGLTQNQNESFNGTIWNRIPQGTYVGLRQLEIGVYYAIAHFNTGSKAAVLVFEKLGMSPGQHMLNGCLSKNKSRTINARLQSTISKKMRLRYNRAEKKHKSDKTKSKEGKVYGAGAF